MPDDADALVDPLREQSTTTRSTDLALAGLLVDGFSPQVFDQALSAMNSIEASFTADGPGWHRLALGCWAAAAALAYEAARHQRKPLIRTIRSPIGSLIDLEVDR